MIELAFPFKGHLAGKRVFLFFLFEMQAQSQLTDNFIIVNSYMEDS